MNTKKILLLIGIVFVLITGAILFVTSKSNQTAKLPTTQPSPQMSKIRVAYINFNKAYTIPLTIAAKKGFFKKNNVNPEIQIAQTSPAKLLVSQQSDVILSVPFSSLTASIEGADISWVGNILNDSNLLIISNKPPQAMKTIAISSVGGALAKARTTLLLKELNINSKNITFKEVKNEQIAFTTLMSKTVDAASGTFLKSDWLIFQKKNKLPDSEFKIVANTQDKENLQMNGGVITTNSFLSNNKIVVENFIKALIEATAWTRLNKEEAIKLLADELNIGSDEATAYMSDYITLTDNLTFAPNKAQAESMLQLASDINPKAKNYPIDKFLFQDIADSLSASGFLTKFGIK